MSKKIKAEELQKIISRQLTDYLEDIEEDVKETTDKTIKEAKQELIKDSPRSRVARDEKYYRGWAIKTGGRTRKKRYYGKILWNKTNYQLTHLLEFKHKKSNGDGYVNPQPHIRKVEEKYAIKFADTLEAKIKRRSR